MEEKILIKSEKYNVSKLFRVMVIIGVALTVLAIVISMIDESQYYDVEPGHICDEYCHDGYLGCDQYEYGNVFNFCIAEYFEWWNLEIILLNLIPVASMTLIGGLIYLWLRSFELTVADKRIFGKVAWGKRVDLPVDSVSATATLSLFKGVSVSTSSGKISFCAIKNANEIYEVINNLLIERQQKRNNATVITPVTNTTDEADQIKKFKELLDSGVITQEEFDAKKKQLLGL